MNGASRGVTGVYNKAYIVKVQNLHKLNPTNINNFINSANAMRVEANDGTIILLPHSHL